MKTLIINFLIVVTLAALATLPSCNKQEGMNKAGYLILEDMPGTSLNHMVLDNNHVFYFVTSEFDKEVEVPVWSSYMPFRYYLSRKTSETGNFEVMNDRFVNGKLCFDKNNHLWCYDYKTVYKIEGNSYNKIVELPPNQGSFQFLAVDHNNNIWAGGMQTGLYKIDNHLNITHYDTNNAIFPSIILDAIHIDQNNTVWVGFWGGVIKISDDQWIVHNNFTSQRIWCMVTDKNGHLWAGTGWSDANQSLVRFDGTRWETINPRNDNNEIVQGTVRSLRSDGQKMYVVSEQVKNLTFHSNELLTFDGVKWEKVHEVPEDDRIADLIVDNYRKIVYVRTSNKGIFKIPIK